MKNILDILKLVFSLLFLAFMSAYSNSSEQEKTNTNNNTFKSII